MKLQDIRILITFVGLSAGIGLFAMSEQLTVVAAARLDLAKIYADIEKKGASAKRMEESIKRNSTTVWLLLEEGVSNLIVQITDNFGKVIYQLNELAGAMPVDLLTNDGATIVITDQYGFTYKYNIPQEGLSGLERIVVAQICTTKYRMPAVRKAFTKCKITFMYRDHANDKEVEIGATVPMLPAMQLESKENQPSISVSGSSYRQQLEVIKGIKQHLEETNAEIEKLKCLAKKLEVWIGKSGK